MKKLILALSLGLLLPLSACGSNSGNGGQDTVFSKFDGKLENSELKGCTKLEKIEYIKEIPAPGILIFWTLYVLFLCMGWIKVTDFVLFMISFVIIIMIDRRSTLRRGTKKIKKYIQKFNRE